MAVVTTLAIDCGGSGMRTGHATVRGSIVWANGRIGREALVEDAILGRHCHVGRAATVGAGAVLGDKSVVTDCSRTRG